MSSGVSLTAPIQPHEVQAPMLRGIDDIVRRITAAAAVEGRGHDLMLRVYLAGMYHGVTAARSAIAPGRADTGAT